MSSRYQLWGGCFQEGPSDVLRRINDSLTIDVRLYKQDIQGSHAWARELHLSGYISDADYKAIQEGLKMATEPIKTSTSDRTIFINTFDIMANVVSVQNKVEAEITDELSEKGRLSDNEEDIHSVVERRLQLYAGEAALRLHTARSRNDQSATNTKLWMLSSLPQLLNEIKKLIEVLVNRAETEIDIIIPGYTHLQRAQPIRWSHFLLSYAWMLRDDITRLEEQKKRLMQCPLGSGALAGCALAIDRVRLAHSLGFTDVTPNSLFAVGSRDHIVEFLNWTSTCGLHLSKLAEDLIIYGSQEFAMVRFSDQYSTGSSLMPQKRNPDGLELIRGAAGLLLGDAFAFSCVLKGLPSTYNKDLQSDKEILFRSFDKLMDCLKVATGTISTMKIDSGKALASLESSMFSTDLAHALVRRGVAFRRAHHAVGVILQRAATLGVDLRNLPHQEYMAICPEFGTKEDIENLFSWETSVEQYTSVGGTSKTAVFQQISQLKDWLEMKETISL